MFMYFRENGRCLYLYGAERVSGMLMLYDIFLNKTLIWSYISLSMQIYTRFYKTTIIMDSFIFCLVGFRFSNWWNTWKHMKVFPDWSGVWRCLDVMWYDVMDISYQFSWMFSSVPPVSLMWITHLWSLQEFIFHITHVLLI